MRNLVRLYLASSLFLATGAALQAQTFTVMPMGDSITLGVDYDSDAVGGGYRAPLYTDLTALGFSPQFVGANDNNPGTLPSSEQDHNGYGFYMVQDLTNNLNGDVQPSPGDYNEGGYWLTGGHGTGRSAVSPNIVLLEIGTNDFLQQQQSGIDQRISTLVSSIHSLSPSTIVLIAGAIPIYNNSGFNAEITAYDSYIQTTLVPSDSYTRYVDLYDDFFLGGVTNPLLYSGDGIHPSNAGYDVMAGTWASAISQVEAPEPSASVLAAIGLMALFLIGWNKRRI